MFFTHVRYSVNVIKKRIIILNIYNSSHEVLRAIRIIVTETRVVLISLRVIIVTTYYYQRFIQRSLNISYRGVVEQ